MRSYRCPSRPHLNLLRAGYHYAKREEISTLMVTIRNPSSLPLQPPRVPFKMMRTGRCPTRFWCLPSVLALPTPRSHSCIHIQYPLCLCKHSRRGRVCIRKLRAAAGFSVEIPVRLPQDDCTRLPDKRVGHHPRLGLVTSIRDGPRETHRGNGDERFKQNAVIEVDESNNCRPSMA